MDGGAARDQHAAGDFVVAGRQRESDDPDGLALPSEVLAQPLVDVGVEIVHFTAPQVIWVYFLTAAKKRSAAELSHSNALLNHRKSEIKVILYFLEYMITSLLLVDAIAGPFCEVMANTWV